MELRVILVDVVLLMSLLPLAVAKPWGLGLRVKARDFENLSEISGNKDALNQERRFLDFNDFLADLHSPAHDHHGDSRTPSSVLTKRHSIYGIPVRNYFPADLKRELLPVSNRITPFGTRLFLKTEKPIAASRNLFRYG